MMDDLISRLSEIRSQYNCFNESDEPYYHALSEVIKMLSEQADGDTISRQAVIDALHAQFKDGFDGDKWWNSTHVLAAIESVPSAEPEIIRCKDCKHNPKDAWFGCPMSHLSETQKPDTAWCWKGERKDDSISRQAAIKAVRHAWAKGLEPMQFLEDLPTVQPEPRWIPCESCERRCDKWERSKT